MKKRLTRYSAKVPAILHAAITNLLVFHKFLDQNLNYRAHIRADDQEQEEVAPVAPELDTIDADDERADNDHTVALGPSTAGEWGLNFAPLTEAQLMSGLTVNERMVKLLDHPGLTNHLLRAKNLLPLLVRGPLCPKGIQWLMWERDGLVITRCDIEGLSLVLYAA